MSSRSMVIRRFSIVAAAALLCACTINTTVEDSAIDYNTAIERTVNETTLRNILRARDRLPRHYTAISQISGNLRLEVGGTVGSTLPAGATRGNIGDVPNRSRAPDSFAPSLTGNFVSNPTFTVSVLESQEFYNGITQPISKDLFGALVSQGWDAELLTHLLIEKFVVTDVNGIPTFVLANDCTDPDFLAVAEEIEYDEAPSKDVISQIDLPSVDPDQLIKLWNEGVEVENLSTPQTPRYRLTRTKVINHLRIKVTPGVLSSIGVPQDVTANIKFLNDGAIDLSNPDARVQIVTRSPDNMIYALGEYLRSAECSVLIGASNEPYFEVFEGDPPDALVSTEFRGQMYSIVEAKGNRAPQVLGLVQQLINLSRKGEEPPSSTFIQLN